MKTYKKVFIALTLLAILLGMESPAKAAPGDTTRASVASDGTQGNGLSEIPALSEDGRYVAFESDASNLVADDTNAYSDIFVYDRQIGNTTRVSIASEGTQGNGNSNFPSLSADGRYVTFYSEASNLVSGDTNGYIDAFVHDRQTHVTTRVSIASDGTQGNNISGSFAGAISADGRYVAFASLATNLVIGDTNGYCDVFVHDRQTGITTRVSVNSNGAQGRYGNSENPTISADGRYVAFQSDAWDLVSEVLNTRMDIFVHDRQTGITTQESVNSNGSPGTRNSKNASLSADGRYVAFQTSAFQAFGFQEIYTRDRQTGIVTRVSQYTAAEFPGADSGVPSISANGRYVAFYSELHRLVGGDTNGVGDIFLYDLQTGITTRVSVASNGTQENNVAYYPSISGDGRYVAFESLATNLVDGDSNNVIDIFVHENDFIVPTVSNIRRANGNPARRAVNVDFTVIFSEAVTGVNTSAPFSDFALVTTGVTGASIKSVSGSGTTYTVKVNTGSGNGTIRLDIVDDDSIRDAANNPLGGAGAGNGNYINGEEYTIIKTNGIATTGVFRPINGILFLKHSHNTGFADVGLNYGVPGDYPVVGDWDGDGNATIGVYRNGSFFLRNENTIGFADKVFPFGQTGDQPVAGDWDGDGIDTIGVYRPSNGQFMLRNSNDAGSADISFFLGNVGDVGIVGDWNGDGLDTTGVFRPINGILFLKNTNDTGFADVALNYGIPGDKPVTGDWDNNGTDTIGVYRNGRFFLRNSNDIGFADIVFDLGNPGDMPIAGNWDGSIP